MRIEVRVPGRLKSCSVYFKDSNVGGDRADRKASSLVKRRAQGKSRGADGNAGGGDDDAHDHGDGNDGASALHVPADELLTRVANATQLPLDRLGLVHRGRKLDAAAAAAEGEDEDRPVVPLRDGDIVIAHILRSKPAQPVKRDEAEEEEQDSDRLFRSTFRDWKSTAKFSILLALWIAGYFFTWHAGWAPLYLLGTIVMGIFTNLGKRREGEVSAWSVFNEDFRELPGTLNAEAFDQQIRHGNAA